MFVDRNPQGAIVSAFASRQRPGQEEVADGAPELGAILRPAPTVDRLRHAAYPPTSDQLDAIWKALDALAAGRPIPPDAVEVRDAIATVKARFPKAGK